MVKTIRRNNRRNKRKTNYKRKRANKTRNKKGNNKITGGHEDITTFEVYNNQTKRQDSVILLHPKIYYNCDSYKKYTSFIGINILFFIGLLQENNINTEKLTDEDLNKPNYILTYFRYQYPNYNFVEKIINLKNFLDILSQTNTFVNCTIVKLIKIDTPENYGTLRSYKQTNSDNYILISKENSDIFIYELGETCKKIKYENTTILTFNFEYNVAIVFIHIKITNKPINNPNNPDITYLSDETAVLTSYLNKPNSIITNTINNQTVPSKNRKVVKKGNTLSSDGTVVLTNSLDTFNKYKNSKNVPSDNKTKTYTHEDIEHTL
jgi:hypothetical protein